MRNLKRALSLALASVMLMGMMVVGSSAASYPDVDDQDHVEAIEVLSAVGVIVGDNGNFRPEDSVSRNEMAVIMAKLILGTYKADSYVGNHPFNDVPDWASRYVAACYNAGIISGRGEGVYDGSSTVTAVEAAAMMLRALGYEDLSKGAAQWDQPVAAKANQINLFEGLAGASNAPMDRNSVAQLALNALEATMVITEKEGDIEIPGTIVIPGKITYKTVEANDSYARAIDATGGTTAGGFTVQLGEQLYKGDLKKTATTDAFERPSTEWSYKSASVNEYAQDADATYTKEVKISDIYRDLGLSKQVENSDVDFFVDGEEEADEFKANDNTTKLSDIALTRNGTHKDVKIGGNGVLVQAYKKTVPDGQGVKTVVYITIINTYVLQVDGDYNDKKEELRLSDLEGVKALPGATSTKLSSEDFANLDTFADEDYVLVTVAKKEIQTIEAAEALTETVTAYVAKKGDDNSNSVTAGSTYKYNKNYTAKTYEIGEEYVLVLDKYGYVVFADGVDAADQYLYVVAADKQGGVKGNAEADVYFSDGTSKVITLTSGSELGSTSSNTPVHAWYSYETKSGGKYELTALTGSKAVGNGNTGVTNLGITDTNTAKVRYGTNKSFMANSDTTFIVLKGDTVTVYNGIREVPEIKANNSDSVCVNAVMDGAYAKYVFIGGDNMVIKGGVDSHIYIYDEEPTVTNKDGDKIYTYKVIKDGELTTIDMSGKTYASGKNWSLGLYGNLSADGNGSIETADFIDDDTAEDMKAYKVSGPGLKISGDVLAIGSYDLVLDREREIWVSDGDDTTTLTNSQFNRDYSESFKGVLFVVMDDDKVTEVYVEENDAVFNKTDESPAAKVWQQPETEEQAGEWIQDSYDNGVYPKGKNVKGCESLIDVGVKQYVTVDNTGKPTIHFYGTIDANKVYNKDNATEADLKALSIWYYGLNDTTGEPNSTFGSMENALKTIYGSDGSEKFASIMWSFGDLHKVGLVKEGDDGGATNGAGNTSVDWGDFVVDFSELKFPA